MCAQVASATALLFGVALVGVAGVPQTVEGEATVRWTYRRESHDDFLVKPHNAAEAHPSAALTEAGEGEGEDGAPALDLPIRNRRRFHPRPAGKASGRPANNASVIPGNATLRCDDRGDTGDGMLFFSFWTTSQASFEKNRRMQRSIESVFYHHPLAEVVVFSDTLTNETEALTALRSVECAVSVQPMQPADWFRGTPLEQWDMQAASTGRYFYSHLTDALRFAVLYHTGGIYFDTDIIFLRPVNALSNVLGYQRDVADTFFRLGSLVGKDANGALLIFHQHHRFVQRCMEEFVNQYDPTVWDCVGPRLIKSILDEAQSWPHGPHAEQEHVTAMPAEAFYPSDWPRWLLYEVDCRVAAVVPAALDVPLSDEINSDLAALPPDQLAARAAELHAHSYAYHFWNRFSHQCPARAGSVFEYVLNRFCVLCGVRVD